MQPPRKKVVPLALAALATSGVLPSAGGAKQAGEGCVAPDVVGVNLAMARRALNASGCGVAVRQLPGHGPYVTPSGPDGRQLVDRQSPAGGGRTRAVTLFLEPLCAQPAQPGPKHDGAEQRRGPTELVAGVYLQGGPLRTSARCRNALPEGGTLTVSSSAGNVLASRRVREGHFAVFPLAPGSYVLAGSVSRAGARLSVPATAFTIAARRTTRVNAVVVLP